MLQAPSPNFDLIPQNDVLGVTVILVTCSFLEHEFVRIGYYVNNEYSDPIDPELPLPNPLELVKIYRNILVDQPRVTRFPIDWSGQSYQNTDNKEGVLQIPQLSPEEMPTAMDEDDIMNNDGEEEDSEDDEEEGDDEGEVELGEEEDNDEEEEGEEDGDEMDQEDDDMEMVNEDSMDVAKMQSLIQ